jgi:hypothetical protein
VGDANREQGFACAGGLAVDSAEPAAPTSAMAIAMARAILSSIVSPDVRSGPPARCNLQEVNLSGWAGRRSAIPVRTTGTTAFGRGGSPE